MREALARVSMAFMILTLGAFSSIGAELTPLLEKEICRRIENHLIVRDTASAVAEAEVALKKYPSSPALCEVALKAFSRGGSETRALQTFHTWQALSQEKPPRRLYEELGWGIISKGESSSSPLIRTMALLSAFWCQDARGLKLIERALSDSHALVRLAAAEVMGKMQDEPLKRAVAARLAVESDWDVRLELIRSVGSMKIKEKKRDLIELIANPTTTLEEKGAATEALLSMLETVPREELEVLAKSDRVSLRALAAEIIAFLHMEEAVDLLQPLIYDERAAVRGQAALGLAILRASPDRGFKELLVDRSFAVQLAAAYGILLSGSREADGWIHQALHHESKDNCRLVASMLAASGSFGRALAKSELSRGGEFYVRMNLALAVMDEEALDILYEGITTNKERWSRERKGVFCPLVPSKETHKLLIPNWPEVVNKETRLELLSILAIKEHPRALQAVRAFLKDKDWGVCGITSALLLTEGDDGAAEMIRILLKDPDESIALQAALILSRWDPDEAATGVLIENYPHLPREKKEIVLQTLGKLRSEQATRFLVDEMGSLHASIRLIASASLLRGLYE